MVESPLRLIQGTPNASADRAVQWLGKLAATLKVPGSNPGLRYRCQTVRPRPPQWLSGSALKLVDGKCQVQSSIALVDLAVWSFPWFSPKHAYIWPRIP